MCFTRKDALIRSVEMFRFSVGIVTLRANKLLGQARAPRIRAPGVCLDTGIFYLQ